MPPSAVQIEGTTEYTDTVDLLHSQQWAKESVEQGSLAHLMNLDVLNRTLKNTEQTLPRVTSFRRRNDLDTTAAAGGAGGTADHVWRRRVRALVSTGFFRWFITVIIILNTLTLALYYPKMPLKFERALTISNYVWTFIFVVEAALKVCVVCLFVCLCVCLSVCLCALSFFLCVCL